ncbi:MAG: hypothetical protein GWN79_27450, partial [Actinobacteria bacterium]|nr:hypothetical protein [Actinomycetota bacterium]NIU22545.1 hypothetical protein [Actinomycetota bacterium]NIX53882.1 hypothetical protein [Actinomycetota bacterium]
MKAPLGTGAGVHDRLSEPDLRSRVAGEVHQGRVEFGPAGDGGVDPGTRGQGVAALAARRRP